MRKERWSKFPWLSIIFALTILVLYLPVAIKKMPRITYKFAQVVKVVEQTINWGLNPGSVVATTGIQVHPLSLRSNSIAEILSVSDSNPRYFVDNSGRPIYLTGSHTWQNLQDSGSSSPLSVFNHNAYLDFLQENNHNFFRLWTWEQPRWSLDSPDDNFRFFPAPYSRDGPELATDGLPKFDLTQFNQDYFDRLRERVVEAGRRGIYVSIMLFNGWSIAADKGIPGGRNPWRSHPFNIDNNINGINGDSNGDGSGEEVHELGKPTITKIQEAYVRRVIDTVGDLDNVLYEISNESQPTSAQWQYHIIQFIKSYEATKPKQHPVGMTSNGRNSDLLVSPADWISPSGDFNDIEAPPQTDGHKIILADTDHLCGICGDRQWVWKSLTQGENPIFMDVYDGSFDLIIEQVPADPLNYAPWVNLRLNMGYALTYANRINLAEMVPRPDLASSGYCLANPSVINAEYLIYAPLGGRVTVDLSAVQGEIIGEWFDPARGFVMTGIKTEGGSRRLFTTPFKGDAILYLKSNKVG